ncbi:MAG: uL15m family ribosomal protein [bacterium]|nr:uL15m family ribosomal protein [bacterium]
MQLHNLTGNNKKKRRIGRGGKRGTTSGRGQKGQKSRSGHRIRPAIRDYLKQIPKRRGRHKHSFISPVTKALTVNVRDLDAHYAAGDVVSPKSLAAKDLITAFGKRMPHVKILGSGKLTKRLMIKACTVSASAKQAIEGAGGSIQ